MPVVPSMAKRPKLWSCSRSRVLPSRRRPADGNPIDAFVQAMYADKKVTPVGPADQRTLLRRVYLDLIGIPPTPAEQDAFLKDKSPDAYEKLIDRLLASEQHGVRYARHWLDVLRYADADERMNAAPGIHYWRDWVINALNSDVPYDQFVRAQLTGYRTTERTPMAAVGRRIAAGAPPGRYVRPRLPRPRRRHSRRRRTWANCRSPRSRRFPPPSWA